MFILFAKNLETFCEEEVSESTTGVPWICDHSTDTTKLFVTSVFKSRPSSSRFTVGASFLIFQNFFRQTWVQFVRIRSLVRLERPPAAKFVFFLMIVVYRVQEYAKTAYHHTHATRFTLPRDVLSLHEGCEVRPCLQLTYKANLFNAFYPIRKHAMRQNECRRHSMAFTHWPRSAARVPAVRARCGHHGPSRRYSRGPTSAVQSLRVLSLDQAFAFLPRLLCQARYQEN